MWVRADATEVAETNKRATTTEVGGSGDFLSDASRDGRKKFFLRFGRHKCHCENRLLTFGDGESVRQPRHLTSERPDIYKKASFSLRLMVTFSVRPTRVYRRRETSVVIVTFIIVVRLV